MSQKEQRYRTIRDCTLPTNWRTLRFGFAVKKTESEQSQNRKP